MEAEGDAVGVEWPSAVRRELTALGSATLHEAAGQVGALPPAIKPVHPHWTVCGPAFPVACAPFHNIFIHEAVYAAPRGSVLVVSTDGGHDAGYWGDILSTAASQRGLAGVVLDGGARDSAALAELDFPVFSRGLAIRGTGKSRSCGAAGTPVTIGEVTVRAGDLVLGDADGVVVVPAAQLPRALQAAHTRARTEEEVVRRLRAGESSLSIYGF